MSRPAPVTITADEYNAMHQGKGRNKYGAKRTVVDGIAFASKAEANRYGELKIMQDAGEIAQLTLHPVFPLIVNGKKIGRFTADFMYLDNRIGEHVIEDVKGGRSTRTEAYSLRKRVFEASTGLKLTEVGR